MELIIIKYKTGVILAFKKNNPYLIETLIQDFDLIEEIIQGELIEAGSK